LLLDYFAVRHRFDASHPAHGLLENLRIFPPIELKRYENSFKGDSFRAASSTKCVICSLLNLISETTPARVCDKARRKNSRM
jgi:hypothetical protein